MSEHRLSAAEKMLARLEKAAANFNIVGDGAINFAGNLKDGFTATLDGVSSSGQAPAAAATVTVCEADFEGDITVAPSEHYAIVFDNSFAFRITQIQLSFDGGLLTLKVGYGEHDAEDTYITFGSGEELSINDDTFTSDDLAIDIPVMGFVALATHEINDDPDSGSGSVHWKIHYTYNCADAP